MRVLFAATELAPIAKVGGLGDVAAGLPRALAGLGAKLQIIIPKYARIKRSALAPVLKNFPVRLGNKTEKINLYKLKRGIGGTEVFLVENKKYLSRGPIYFERTAFAGSFREIRRFLFFSKAVFELLRGGALAADIIHLNDWHTGALATLLKKNFQFSRPGAEANFHFQKPKVFFTIHNLANQGKWGARQTTSWFGKNGFKNSGGNFNFMLEGIRNADIVTTVSPNYAREIKTKQYGEGLERWLKKRAASGALRGILNGTDYDYWPPQKRHKKKFQRKLGLKIGRRLPVFGLVARLTEQKGISMIIPLAGKFVKKYGAQFVFLGQGEEKNERALKKLAEKYPKNVFTKIAFDEKLARAIYAQSDFFLMPSIFEPSGLGQMIAMRYGTIPIVRATGGLKDTVRDGTTGFVFKNISPAALSLAAERAITAFSSKKTFKKIIAECKRQNFGWGRSAKKYLALYKQLLAR